MLKNSVPEPQAQRRYRPREAHPRPHSTTGGHVHPAQRQHQSNPYPPRPGRRLSQSLHHLRRSDSPSSTGQRLGLHHTSSRPHSALGIRENGPAQRNVNNSPNRAPLVDQRNYTPPLPPRNKTSPVKNKMANEEIKRAIAAPSQRSGQALSRPSSSSRMDVHHRPIVRNQYTTRDPESALTKSFDPMKDRHMWTMWRTAVTGRIFDEVRRLEKDKNNNDLSSDGEDNGMYGTALLYPPLRRFIRLGEGSKEIAKDLMSQGQGRLLASQFVYYGLPRACITNPKSS